MLRGQSRTLETTKQIPTALPLSAFCDVSLSIIHIQTDLRKTHEHSCSLYKKTHEFLKHPKTHQTNWNHSPQPLFRLGSKFTKFLFWIHLKSLQNSSNQSIGLDGFDRGWNCKIGRPMEGHSCKAEKRAQTLAFHSGYHFLTIFPFFLKVNF